MAKRKEKKSEPSLLLRCGCTIRFIDGKAPICPEHGNQPVARVLAMPKPTFRGTAKGPLVQTMDLPAHVGRLVGSDQES